LTQIACEFKKSHIQAAHHCAYANGTYAKSVTHLG